MLETTIEMHRGRRVRVAQLGNGPPLILLHGYPDTLQVWSRLAPLLSAAHRVIAFDWPGMGQSEAWPGGATPFDMAERLRTLLDDWQLDKATVLGMDMGGQPALVFAARHRQRVRSLVVMNSLVQWDEKTSWEINLLRRFGWNRFALHYLPGMVFGRALRTFLAPGEELDPPVRSDMWQSFRNSRVRDFIIRMCAGYQGTLPHLAQMYPSIDTPTLVYGLSTTSIFRQPMASGFTPPCRTPSCKSSQALIIGWHFPWRMKCPAESSNSSLTAWNDAMRAREALSR